MQTVLSLSIFDDGDTVPTMMVTWLDDGEEITTELLNELREAAEQEYGRPAPDHAIFVHCEPKPA